MRQRFTYSNVVATLALGLALGGTSYAALHIPTRSIGSRQLALGAVNTAELHTGAVTLPKISDSARKLLKGKPGSPGPIGPKGPAGPQGPAGVGTQRISYFSTTLGTTPQLFFSHGGLELYGLCHEVNPGNGSPIIDESSLSAMTPIPGGLSESSLEGTKPIVHEYLTAEGTSYDLGSVGSRGAGFASDEIYYQRGGEQISVRLVNAYAASSGCRAYGTVLATP